MVIRKIHPLKWWIVLAIVLMIFAIGVPIGVNLYTVAQSEKHACQALDILIAIPAPKPSNPKTNPSREQNFMFHNALVYWHDADGC